MTKFLGFLQQCRWCINFCGIWSSVMTQTNCCLRLINFLILCHAYYFQQTLQPEIERPAQPTTFPRLQLCYLYSNLPRTTLAWSSNLKPSINVWLGANFRIPSELGRKHTRVPILALLVSKMVCFVNLILCTIRAMSDIQLRFNQTYCTLYTIYMLLWSILYMA